SRRTSRRASELLGRVSERRVRSRGRARRRQAPRFVLEGADRSVRAQRARSDRAARRTVLVIVRIRVACHDLGHHDPRVFPRKARGTHRAEGRGRRLRMNYDRIAALALGGILTVVVGTGRVTTASASDVEKVAPAPAEAQPEMQAAIKDLEAAKD